MGPELLPRRRREAWVEPALGGGESPGPALLTVEGPAVEARSALYAGRNADLLARFAAFWPRGMAGPPSMPWLGGLVDRTGAYLWASAFPDRLAGLDARDQEAIADFVVTSLVGDADDVREGHRKLCGRRGREKTCSDWRRDAEAYCRPLALSPDWDCTYSNPTGGPNPDWPPACVQPQQEGAGVDQPQVLEGP